MGKGGIGVPGKFIMWIGNWFTTLVGLASLSSAKFPVTNSPLAQSANPFTTSLIPRLRDILLHSRDLPTGTCNVATSCVNGACCGSNNLCGYSATFCGTGCQQNCGYLFQVESGYLQIYCFVNKFLTYALR